jgi:predicted enzyme related to lactoylglutathione lyase
MADRFFWYELMTSDQDAALDFYTEVVGWTAADHVNPGLDFRYTILSAGERGIGGVMQITDQMREGGACPGWVGYVHVDDADAKAKSIAEAGGQVLMGPDDIPNVGRFAMVADPGGAPFYVMAPLPRDDVPPEPDPQTPGLISWHELYSSLGDKAAFDFYAGQFGWETIHEMDMGPMGTYRIFGACGVQMGGMMNKPDRIPSSLWGFYINVDGLDAAVERVKAKGGEVLNGPMDVPGGSWIVQCRDPQGAGFNLVSPTR